MMNNKRIITFSIFAILICSFLLYGCDHRSNSPEESAGIYCYAIYKSDTKGLKRIGLSKSEIYDYSHVCQDQFKRAITEPLINIGFNFTDELTDDVWDALQAKLSDVKYEVKEINTEDEIAEVEISTTYIDLKSIKEKASNDALEETANTKLDDEDSDHGKAFADSYLKNLKEGIENADLSTDTIKTTLEFFKDWTSWVANEPHNIAYSLIQLATNNELPDLYSDDEKVSPEESAQAFYDLAFKNDLDSISKLGYNEAFAKEFREVINEDPYKDLARKFRLSYEYAPTESQVKNILDSLKNAIGNNSVTFKVTKCDEYSSDITASTPTIDIDSLINLAKYQVESQLMSSEAQDKQQIADAYYENIAEQIKTVKPSTITNEKTFTFYKVSDIWAPIGAIRFINGIENMFLNLN